MNAETQTDPAEHLLDDYIPEEQMAQKRRVTKRTLRAERQRGDGPPFVKDGIKVYYHGPGYRDWLAAKMKRPVRGPGANLRQAGA
jgi:hypothetical protein